MRWQFVEDIYKKYQYWHKKSAPFPTTASGLADFIRQCKRYTLYSTQIGPMRIVNSDLKSCSGKARLKTVRHGGEGVGGGLAYSRAFFQTRKTVNKGWQRTKGEERCRVALSTQLRNSLHLKIILWKLHKNSYYPNKHFIILHLCREGFIFLPCNN